MASIDVHGRGKLMIVVRQYLIRGSQGIYIGSRCPEWGRRTGGPSVDRGVGRFDQSVESSRSEAGASADDRLEGQAAIGSPGHCLTRYAK